jgi:hypothetical protein
MPALAYKPPFGICLAGWYFHGPLITTLKRLAEEYPCFIVAHRDFAGFTGGPSKLEKMEIGSRVIPNVGLEWGCYDYYLKNIWNGGSVLFMHDDSEITEEALAAIASIKFDQCYLFTTQEDAKINGYAHGRAMFCSHKFLTRLLADGGFWYDEGNKGSIGPTLANSPNVHNAGIQMFRSYLNSLTGDPKALLKVGQVGIVAGLNTGYRGTIVPVS